MTAGFPNDPKLVSFTLDLEPDFGGRTGTLQAFAALENFERFAGVVRRFDLKFTIFVVGQLLERPVSATQGVLDRLEALGAEFELHGYRHSVNGQRDRVQEIRLGKAAFRRYFGRDPRGYRAPFCRITIAELQVLATEGFRYDSSISASWTRTVRGRVPATSTDGQVAGLPLVELPPTVLPFVRLPFALSYMKLLGPGFYQTLIRMCGLPRRIVFYCHLHDLFPLPSFALLPRVQKFKWLLRRNKGIEIFESCVRQVLSKGYQSVYMSELSEIRKGFSQELVAS